MDKNRKDYKKLSLHLNVVFFASLFISVLFVAGIPCIPIGAKKSTFLMVFGIVGTAVGFYGTPLMWVYYGSLKKSMTVLEQIFVNGVTNVIKLASVNNLPEVQMRSKLNYMIRRGYLTDVIIVQDQIVSTSEGKIQVETTTAETVSCPYCNAKVKVFNGKGVCEYCRSIFTVSEAHQNESARGQSAR